MYKLAIAVITLVCVSCASLGAEVGAGKRTEITIGTTVKCTGTELDCADAVKQFLEGIKK
jgi:hypothetical protein